MIHDLKKQGLSLTAIARKVGCDRKTVRKYLERGLEGPVYGPRLLRDIRDLGYEGGYTAVTDFLRDVRPSARTQFERRFETPPGRQAQFDFAEFTVAFTTSRRCKHRLPGSG